VSVPIWVARALRWGGLFLLITSPWAAWNDGAGTAAMHLIFGAIGVSSVSHRAPSAGDGGRG